MSDENIRHKALNLLKLSSAAFVESYQRHSDEKNAVASSSVYLQEYTNLLTSSEYIDLIKKCDLIKPTELKASDFFKTIKRDCAGSFDVSCKSNEVSDENVKALVGRLNASSSNMPNNINFEKDFNSILDSIEKVEMEISSNESDEKMNFSLSDPIDLASNKAIEKPRRSSETEKHPVNVPSKSNQFFTQNTDKKVLHNPFKKPKIDKTNDISTFFTQHSQKESIKDTIQKVENKIRYQNDCSESELRKEYELEFYRSRKEDQRQEEREKAAKSKFSNPWKEEKSNNFFDKFDSKEDKHNPFDTKLTKNTAKENCINKNQKYTRENVEKQHSTKLNTFKSHVEERKNDAKQINNPFSSFRTGHQELEWQKNLQKRPPQRGLSKKRAIPNVVEEQQQMSNNNTDPLRKKFHCPSFPKADDNKNKKKDETEEVHADLKSFDSEILKRIEREIVIDSKKVSWDDIIGLEAAKKLIKESVILAIRRPDLFTGLRESSRAIMLFGPPGTGKTLIGKCIASSCDATFMSVSASSLTSKWIGESETLVRAMFTYAKIKQPCVIFFDEIDSLLEKRSEQGNETFNRIKTEFLVQLDGANALKETDRVLLIGATNRPDVIDEAILRRFTKRILVPLPVKQARINMFRHLLSKHCHTLTNSQIDKIADHCEKYSGSDISQVCKEAAMMSLRRLDPSTVESIKVADIPPISPKDFVTALRNVKPTVSQETINKLEKWNNKFGSSIETSNTNDIDDNEFFNDDL